MYNNPYEEYMRNSLGYNAMPMMNVNYMEMNPMSEMYEAENDYYCNQTSVDDMYPEIYRIIYPMVCKACMAVNENVSEDLVSRITNEIYVNVEHMESVGENRSTSSSISSQISKSTKSDLLSNKTSSNSNPSSSIVSNVRQEIRQRNTLLNDLIRILVLRELIGNPGRPRPRPPFNPPGRPPYRPPFPGGPGTGPRPPFGF